MGDETPVPPPPPPGTTPPVNPPSGPPAYSGQPPPGSPPSPGVLRLLEMALFTVVFLAGGVLAGLAAVGGTGADISTTQPPIAGPSPTDFPIPDIGSLPPGVVPPGADTFPPGTDLPFNEQVQFRNARGDASPPNGCSAHIDWVWEIDRSLSPPVSGRALIEVTGGDVAGEYHRSITGGEIRLSLDVSLSSSHDVFTADVKSVGGVPAFPTPLEVSYDNPIC